jgi:hypothetical protein
MERSMPVYVLRAFALILGFLAVPAIAATYSVNISNPSPAPPYTTWASASTDIQSAVNETTNGDLVLVNDGAYQSGGYTAPDGKLSAVVVTNAVTLQSVNGAGSTLINGGNAMRCIYVADGAALTGFTVTNGAWVQQGGGIYCHSVAAVVSNCVVIGNTTSPYLAGTVGGGVYQGTLVNCLLENNSAQSGAGACAATLNNCVLTGNSTLYQGQGGGACNGTLNNCLLEGNSAEYGGGAFYATLNSCSLSNNTATLAGGGAYAGVSADCIIVSNTAPYGGGIYLGTLTNCDVTGNSATTGSGGEEDGVLRNCIVYFNIGGNYGSDNQTTNLNYCCTTPFPANSVGDITNDPTFVNQTGGDYHLKPGSPCINSGNNAYASSTTDLDGNPRIAYGTVDLGAYESPYNTSHVHYVSLTSTNPVTPFNGWSIAATNIQNALDSASPGDLILVTNGVYATGGRSWLGQGTNRVTLTNSVTLQSVNGPAVTLIVGSHVPGTGNTALMNAVRCVGMGNNAVLSGFTLTNGEAGDGNYPFGGGVAYIYGAGAGIVTNCILIDNLATNSTGGGADRVTLLNCLLIGNSAEYGGGACACVMTNCTLENNTGVNGGGVFGGPGFGPSAVSQCIFIGNSANLGGGIDGGSLNTCMLSNNIAVDGGGAYGANLYNCLVTGNSASLGGGVFGGTIYDCTVAFNTATSQGGGIYGGTGAVGYNSIIYDNNSISGSNSVGSKFNNCCTMPNPFGGGISNDPAFINPVVGDFHLQSNSPCINSGNNAFVTNSTDLDGNPRIVGGTVDIGVYEYQTPVSVISYAWLQQYGLPTDGSVDHTDLDGTGLNVYQDWVAGLNPTNPASVLAMATPAAVNNTSGIIVTWQSVSGIFYTLQRSTNLPVFTTIRTNIFGLAGTTSADDTTATNSGPYYYRVGVQ